jgi:hypothetical protein
MGNGKVVALKASGPMRLSNYGRKQVSLSMYVKGKNFLGASVMLREAKGNEYVVLHLMCQGIEIVLKAFLLFKDYEKYRGLLKKPLGHDLKRSIATVISEFHLKPLSEAHMKEIELLNSLYANHMLRYGSGYDILVNPSTIPSDLIFRKMIVVIRLAERHISMT